MSCGDSFVQETLDSIDEVARCQAPMAKSSNFFSSGRPVRGSSRNLPSQHSLRPIRDADRKLNLSLWNNFRIPIAQNRLTYFIRRWTALLSESLWKQELSWHR